MTACTDDERREVARRLRRLNAPSLIAMMSILDVGGRDMCARLADLIDPDCDEGRYEGLRTVRPVDREALLELADALEDGFGMTGSPSAAQLKVLAGINVELRAYARIIREALGVES